MELTIEQALQQGVTAHKEGKLQDAERLYRAILQSQPLHPDANHNLGVLAVSVNKAKVALPLFKTALEANPKIEQFWLSYIDALIKEQQFENAKQVYEQAKKQGLDEEKLNILEAQLAPINEAVNANSENPSQEQLSSLLEHYQNGRYDDAEKLGASISDEFPNHSFSWKVLGAVFKATGRKSEAINALETAVVLSPRDADTHFNLGIMLKEQGKLEKAVASYNQAIALKPDFAEALSNLGITLKELGRLNESENSCNRAIALKPDFAEAHHNLSLTLKELGRLEKALTSCAQAIAMKTDFHDAYVTLGSCIKKVGFNSSNPQLYPLLIRLLTRGNFARPIVLAKSILSLLRHDRHIKDFLLEKNVDLSLTKVVVTIESLNELSLLHHLMRLCPLPDLLFEKLFVSMRSFILKNLDSIRGSPKLINFLSTLSIHCFVNEYVYAETDEELFQVEELQANISQIVAQSVQPDVIKILCLASYRPLHKYDWCQKLECLDNLEEVKKRLIEEPLLEKRIAKDIPVLEEISDRVSIKVRGQYEEHPYPRWVKLGIPSKAKSISQVCDQLGLQLQSKNIRNVGAPAILVAGCGTGQHSITTASRFSDCHVTAVDLSLASLAYAKRKSNDLGFTNIDYLQADILHLHQMGKEFDIIESGGVLHHMDDPMAGWRVLVDVLKPGGLMKIGLYSELARRHIVEVRKEITALGVGTSEANIRKFRRLLTESNDENHQLLITSSDFYSLSMMRDLIFHVQEHRFTLPQIKNCLNELGLNFCGFEHEVAPSSFRQLHGIEADIYDLDLWHQHEGRNPDAFAGMYQFWCQKPQL